MITFVEIGPVVPEKKGFYHIYGHDVHLGRVTWGIIYKHIDSTFLYILPIKFGFD